MHGNENIRRYTIFTNIYPSRIIISLISFSVISCNFFFSFYWLQGDCGSSFSMAQKILTWLCPAVHTILSDGLLPSVQGFFGPLPNSPWKVAGASIKQGNFLNTLFD